MLPAAPWCALPTTPTNKPATWSPTIDTGIYIHLAIKSLILPPGLFVLIALFGLLLRRTLVGKTLLLLGPLVLYLFSTHSLTEHLARFVEIHPPLSTAEARAIDADAILVLTAGRFSNAREWDGIDIPSSRTLSRLAYAVRLHRLTGLPLVISGGLGDDSHPPLARTANRMLVELFGIEGALLEERSRDTWQNAEYSSGLLEKKGFSRVLVVTDANHMRRAAYSLSRFGISAIPAPIHHLTDRKRIDSRGGPSWTDWLPSYKAFFENTILLHEIIGMVWYRYTRN